MRFGPSGELTAEKFRTRVLSWLETMHEDGQPVWRYKMNEGADATVFTSCFAVFLHHLFRNLQNLSEEQRHEWIGYVQSFQQEDSGYFFDLTAKERVTDPTHDETHLACPAEAVCSRKSLKETAVASRCQYLHEA